MTEDKPKVKYKPLGIKLETYRKLNEKKAKREIVLGKPISFDILINELMDNAKN
jgi:hypothetical protein